MSRKVIALIKQIPEISSISDDLDKIVTQFNQQKSFIKKQLQNLEKERDEEIDIAFDKIIIILKDQGLLDKSYDKNKQYLEIKDDALFLGDVSDREKEMPDFLKHLLRLD